jgi:hypothetical protein
LYYQKFFSARKNIDDVKPIEIVSLIETKGKGSKDLKKPVNL